MSRAGAVAALAGAALVTAVGALAGPVAVAAHAGTPATAPAADPATAATPGTPRQVVLAAVPGLRWADVSSGQMPHLAALARAGAAASLVVKAAGPVTRCLAGALTVSAGNRADVRAGEAGAGGCAPAPGAWAALRSRNLGGVQGARLGALGDALRASGTTLAASGPAAGWLLVDGSGHPAPAAPDLATALRADVAAVEDPALYAPHDRAAARAQVDGWVADVARRTPAAALLLVLGTSDGATGGRHLHVVVARGAGLRGTLVAASTGRAGYVQLIDVAPTVLAARGLAAPAAMSGTPIRSRGTVPPAPAALADADRHATAAGAIPYAVGLVVADTVLLVAALAAARARLPDRLRARTLGALRPLGVGLACLPAAGYLANALPWWRAGRGAYVALALAAAALAAAVALTAGRRRPARSVVAVAGISLAVVVADQLAGAPLQLAAPLGDSPLIAGRFHGVGNACFAVLATAALLVAAWLPRHRRGLAGAAAVGLGAVVVDGAPALGDDFGGVLSLVPAVALLLALLAGVRVTVRRVVAVAAVTAGAALALAAADYARPPSHRTHIGRFAAEVLHGSAGPVLRRKLDASLGSFTHSAFTALVLVALVYLVLERASLGRLLRAEPALAAGLPAVAVLAVLGAALNDSGVVIPGVAAAVVLPLLVATPRPAATAGNSHARGADLRQSTPS